ncbi:MAG TPA: TolC family protein [Acidiferrobacterales bacterium]|nr:TolC family protein [Acidiferrobacterales bacterium]
MFKSATLLLSFFAALPAIADPLALSEAQDIALAKQPLVQGQEALIQANKQRAVAEAQLPDPKLKLGLNNVPTDSFSLTQDFMTMRTIGIEQMFPGGKKRELRGRLAGNEAEKSAAELESLMRAVKRETAIAWLNLYYPLHAELLVQEQQHEIQNQIEAARINYRTGRGSQDEILGVQNMLNQLIDREQQLAGEIQRARAGLARWIGANDATRELSNDLPDLPVPTSLEQLSAHLIDHPEIRMLDEAIKAAETEANLARESRKPDWSLELSYSKRGPLFSDMVSAQVAVDLPLFTANRQDRISADRSALLDRAHYQREDKLRSLNAELASLYADEGITRERIKLLDERTLPNAQARIASVLIAYRAGKATIASVYEAHHAELEARLQRLAQQVALLRARIQLSYFE